MVHISVIHLFNSKAQITTFKSLKWNLLVLWYLNPQLDQDKFMTIAEIIAHKPNGFATFAIHPDLLRKIVYEVSMLDLDEPPKNKLRKVIFKYGSGLTKEEKLKIVVIKISKLLNCTTRTIHRNMCEELKREKELLNKQI
jgi:hypothetical protein